MVAVPIASIFIDILICTAGCKACSSELIYRYFKVTFYRGGDRGFFTGCAGKGKISYSEKHKKTRQAAGFCELSCIYAFVAFASAAFSVALGRITFLTVSRLAW